MAFISGSLGGKAPHSALDTMGYGSMGSGGLEQNNTSDHYCNYMLHLVMSLIIICFHIPEYFSQNIDKYLRGFGTTGYDRELSSR